jgi:hypothetical protein
MLAATLMISTSKETVPDAATTGTLLAESMAASLVCHSMSRNNAWMAAKGVVCFTSLVPYDHPSW